MNFAIAAISLGFLGSFHCVGMCGPIALALPVKQHTYFAKLVSILIYNFGRVLTYSLFGIIFGIIGQSFVIAGYQQFLSIAAGALILLVILVPSRFFGKYKATSFMSRIVSRLKQKLGKLLQTKNYSSLFFIGVLNGLLPCGLVYAAIAGAIATGNILEGSLFMVLFGAGTIPAMFILSLSGNLISINFRNKIRRAVPLFVSAMAVLLILRGMNLGIPYLSPKMSYEKCEVKSCCHKK